MKTYFNDFWGLQSPHVFLRYSTPAKLLNLCRSVLQLKLRRWNVTAHPFKLVVDITNACNLRCPHCPTGKQVKGRPKGFMELARFNQILDQLGDYVYLIDLFNWGESFLNRDIFKMISMAEQRKVCTRIHTSLNIRLSEEKLEDLLHSKLTYLSVSLDGADQETYAHYRKGGDLALALDHARRIIERRKQTGRRKPHLTWQFLVFPHNRHQVEDARQLSEEIGFDRFVTMPGITSREMQDAESDPPGGVCDWLWTTATFHWDGRIGPCCRQFMARDDFGVLGDGDFMLVWNSEKFQYARSLFSKRPLIRQNILCNHCYKVFGVNQPLITLRR